MIVKVGGAETVGAGVTKFDAVESGDGETKRGVRDGDADTLSTRDSRGVFEGERVGPVIEVVGSAVV